MIVIEILLIVILIVANGLFSMSEIAVVSARQARLQQRANGGDAGARAALELAREPGRLLSTVQIGITLIGILTGAFGGATLAEPLAGRLKAVPWLAPYADAVAFGLVVLVITYLSLIVGELVPKRLGLQNPERVAARVAAPMRRLSRIASPAVRFLSVSTETVLRLLGVRPSQEPPVTEEEIGLLIDQGIQAGLFDKAERDMVARVFHLGDRRVGELATPRTDTVWIDVHDSPEAVHEKITESVHSRFPVGDGSLDNLVGVVQAKDLLAQTLAGRPLDVRAALKQPLYMPETATAMRALEMFRKTRIHIALVVDEYGTFQGVVTINDILGAIVGDLPTMDEGDERLAVRREDGSWLLDGMLPIYEFKEIFNIGALPEEEEGYYQTVGGFVMTRLGRVPRAADRFEWRGLSFEVMDMDGRRVDKLLVTPARQPATHEG